jgi:2-polyprenyl-3-methyl-5-hydroxy-6-metoxy-1,4-benzoquinol methylase
MIRYTDLTPDSQVAWHEQSTAGRVQWLRAGGQLGEWADNTLEDIQFASQVLDLNEGDTILNPGCGWGRHAIALAHYGLNVIGLDTAANLLELARETSKQMNIPIRWVHGDLGDLLLTEPLDAVVQFHGNLLEQTESPAEALYLLDQIHAVLKPDGRFLFGSPDWKATPPHHEQSQAETPESTELYSHTFDPNSRTIQSQAIVIGRDGSQRTYQRRVWHPTAEQMADMLYQASFDIAGQLNDFSFLPYDPNRSGLVWLARRR